MPARSPATAISAGSGGERSGGAGSFVAAGLLFSILELCDALQQLLDFLRTPTLCLHIPEFYPHLPTRSSVKPRYQHNAQRRADRLSKRNKKLAAKGWAAPQQKDA
jgi:hypothetical protein